MLIKNEIIIAKSVGNNWSYNIMRYYNLTDYHQHDQSSQFLIHLNESVLWSYPRNMDTGLSEVLVFKLFRTEAATPTVPPPPIVITFDIIKYRCPHYFPADKVFSMDTFHFQRMKEAFHAGIIVAATFCAHTSTQIMPLQLRLIICWTVHGLRQ